MPVIICPDCDTKLRLNDPLPAGKRVRCPKCSTVFAPHGGEAVTAAPIPRRAARPLPPEEEEPFDEPPRRRKKRPVKSSNAALIWGLAIGGGVLVVAAIVLVLVLVVFAKGKSNPPVEPVAGGPGMPPVPAPNFVPNGNRNPAFQQHEAVAREMVQVLERLVATLQSVKDRNSARQAAQSINQICNQLQSVTTRTKTLPPLAPDEDRRLQDQFMPQIMNLQQRMQQAGFQAGRNSQGEPSFVAAAKRLEQVGQQMQQMGP